MSGILRTIDLVKRFGGRPAISFMVARPVSYSPYPAQFSVSPIYQHIHDLSASPSRVVIVSEEPLMHFRMDAEFHDVWLRINQ